MARPVIRGRVARMWRDISESLRSQPGRVGLSFLAVMVGIVVLTLLLSMLLGLRQQSQQLIRKFGANVIALIPDSKLISDRGYQGVGVLTDLIRQNSGAESAGGMIRLNEAVSSWNQTPVWAADTHLPGVRGWTLVNGRMFDQNDEVNSSRTMLITRETARAFDLHIGDACTIGAHTFHIIGILRDGSGVPDASNPQNQTTGDVMAVIPITTAERLDLKTISSSAAIFIRMDDGQNAEQLISRSDRMLKDPALNTWQMKWLTPEILIRGIRELQRLIALTAGSVAALCLILGGTTLMSLMLADVRQRIPEIGLRRALGATRRDVALLFVVESCVITGAAALGGVMVAGILLGLLAGKVTIPLSLHYFTFFIPVIVSIVLGCIFSFWPARVASGLSPAHALRNA